MDAQIKADLAAIRARRVERSTDEWLAIADDVENNARIERDLAEMAKRSEIDQHKAALIETYTGIRVLDCVDTSVE